VLGHNIGRDGLFGNQTATALGTYFYGAKLGIKTVSQLQTKLNVSSFDKMETAVASKINTIVGNVKSGCNTELTKINKSLSNLNKIQSNLENLKSKFSPTTTLRA
jgi:Skp family chaperone for outer membrane proteins